MNIEKAVIILSNGADEVFLYTDLPEGTWPYNGKLTLRFSVAKDCGREYMLQHFPNVMFDVIDTK